MKTFTIAYWYNLKLREMMVSATSKEEAERKFWLVNSIWDAEIIQIKEDG